MIKARESWTWTWQLSTLIAVSLKTQLFFVFYSHESGSVVLMWFYWVEFHSEWGDPFSRQIVVHFNFLEFQSAAAPVCPGYCSAFWVCRRVSRIYFPKIPEVKLYLIYLNFSQYICVLVSPMEVTSTQILTTILRRCTVNFFSNSPLQQSLSLNLFVFFPCYLLYQQE